MLQTEIMRLPSLLPLRSMKILQDQVTVNQVAADSKFHPTTYQKTDLFQIFQLFFTGYSLRYSLFRCTKHAVDTAPVKN